MTLRRLLGRAGVVTGAASALVLLGTTSASAWHCFVPMYSLNGPTSSANWFVVSAEMGAELEVGYTTECDTAREAGYAALEDAGLPVGLKVFTKMTIGEGANILKGVTDPEYHGPTGSGQGAEHNPNKADGRGLEYFEAGSPVPEDVVSTYIAGASTVSCG